MASTKKAVNDNTPGFFGRMFNKIEYSSAVNALHRLDDKTLSNMGLKRSEINNFVRSWSDRTEDAA